MSTKCLHTEFERLPLFFKYKDRVIGNGFLASVEAVGRVLCVKEDGGFWMYGVEPGGLAAGAESKEEAHAEFRRTYTQILFDIAQSCADEHAFEDHVRLFIHQASPETDAEWRVAVTYVRERGDQVDSDVPRFPADTNANVTVSITRDLAATQNQIAPEPLHAVAA